MDYLRKPGFLLTSPPVEVMEAVDEIAKVMMEIHEGNYSRIDNLRSSMAILEKSNWQTSFSLTWHGVNYELHHHGRYDKSIELKRGRNEKSNRTRIFKYGQLQLAH